MTSLFPEHNVGNIGLSVKYLFWGVAVIS